MRPAMLLLAVTLACSGGDAGPPAARQRAAARSTGTSPGSTESQAATPPAPPSAPPSAPSPAPAHSSPRGARCTVLQSIEIPSIARDVSGLGLADGMLGWQEGRTRVVVQPLDAEGRARGAPRALDLGEEDELHSLHAVGERFVVARESLYGGHGAAPSHLSLVVVDRDGGILAQQALGVEANHGIDWADGDVYFHVRARRGFNPFVLYRTTFDAAGQATPVRIQLPLQDTKTAGLRPRLGLCADLHADDPSSTARATRRARA